MGIVSGLLKAAAGAASGVALVTALPIFGAVGAITAADLAVGSVLGAGAEITEELIKHKKRRTDMRRR